MWIIKIAGGRNLSSVVRYQLEQFISIERSAALHILREARVAAIEKRDHDLSTGLGELESLLMSLMPLKSAFPSPDKYIDALRSYALILAFMTSLFHKVGISKDTLPVAKKLAEVATKETEIILLVENTREILSKEAYGREVFIDGCKRYVNLLAGRIKEFGKHELNIVREVLMEMFSSGKPVKRLSELAKDFGVRERDLYDILKRLPEIDPNIITSKEYVTMKDKLKAYVENLLAEKGYVRISDQARELSLEPKLTIDVFSKVKEIFPEMRILEDKLIYIPNDLAKYIENITKESVILSREELAVKLCLDSKLVTRILEDIEKYFSEVVTIDRMLVNRQKLVPWISEVFKDRPMVFVDEIKMLIGADKKTTTSLLELASTLSRGDIVVRENRVIYKPNVVKLLERVVKERALPEELTVLRNISPEIVEGLIYSRINQELIEFEKNITKRS